MAEEAGRKRPGPKGFFDCEAVIRALGTFTEGRRWRRSGVASRPKVCLRGLRRKGCATSDFECHPEPDIRVETGPQDETAPPSTIVVVTADLDQLAERSCPTPRQRNSVFRSYEQRVPAYRCMVVETTPEIEDRPTSLPAGTSTSSIGGSIAERAGCATIPMPTRGTWSGSIRHEFGQDGRQGAIREVTRPQPCRRHSSFALWASTCGRLHLVRSRDLLSLLYPVPGAKVSKDSRRVSWVEWQGGGLDGPRGVTIGSCDRIYRTSLVQSHGLCSRRRSR